MSTPTTTREPQYSPLIEVAVTHPTSMGMMANYIWHTNPTRLLFTLSRYKFVARMLHGCETAVEIGCADAFATRIVQQTVHQVTATDFDPLMIADALQHSSDGDWPLEVLVHDWVVSPLPRAFDAAFALDVLEHIRPQDEHDFISNIAASLRWSGKLVIGMPSLESQAYASPISKAGHVNCKTGEVLRSTLELYFRHVLLFSMNDEVVHTGYSPMAHYLFAVCSTKY